MLKNTKAVNMPVLIGKLGGEIDMAKKEAWAVAAILKTTVRLIFNHNSYLIYPCGNCVKEEVKKGSELSKFVKGIS